MRWQGFYHHVFCTYSEVTFVLAILFVKISRELSGILS